MNWNDVWLVAVASSAVVYALLAVRGLDRLFASRVRSRPLAPTQTPKPYECWHQLRADLMPESNVPADRILERCGGTVPPNARACKGWKDGERRLAAWLVGRLLGSKSEAWRREVEEWLSEDRAEPPVELDCYPYFYTEKDAGRGVADQIQHDLDMRDHLATADMKAGEVYNVTVGMCAVEYKPYKLQGAGRWVRWKGLLVRATPAVGAEVVDLDDGYRTVASGVPRREVSEAIPMPGEKWTWYRCGRHYAPWEAAASVTQTCPPYDDPAWHEEAARSAVRCGCLVPALCPPVQNIDADADFAASLGDLPRNARSAPLRFRVGQWVRLSRDGRLYRISDRDSTTGRWALSGQWGTFAVDGEIEPAVPRLGEWWRYANQLGPAPPFQALIDESPDGDLGQAAIQGNIVPANYGNGSLGRLTYGARFRPHQWVRDLTDGKLCRVVSVVTVVDPTHYVYDVRSDDSPRFMRNNVAEQTLNPALPHEGERWCYEQCNKHHHGYDQGRGGPEGFTVTKADEEWATSPAGYAADYVKCGCLEPVGYGKGVEAARFRADQWVRHTDGTLGRVLYQNGDGRAVESPISSNHHWSDSEVEPATPRAGEWWVYKACGRHAWGDQPPVRVKDCPPPAQEIAQLERDCLRCGCLVPFNFGRGEAVQA